MPALPDTSSAKLWLPTSSLPAPKPYHLASSPDGSKLYVALVGSGDGTSGAGASIAEITIGSKAIRTIVSGQIYIRALAVHPTTGVLYFASGPNNSSSAQVLQTWDPSTEALGTTAVPDQSFYLIGIDPSDTNILWCNDYTGPAYLRRYNLTTGALLSQHNFSGFPQNRAVAFGATYAYVTEANSGNQHIFTRATGVHLRTPTGGNNSNGVAAVSDTEFYLLSQWGQVRRYNAATDTSSGDLTTGLPVLSLTDPNRGYGDIEITSLGRVFVSRGGWSADRANIAQRDEASGTDVGIYELNPVSDGLVVGFLQLGNR